MYWTEIGSVAKIHKSSMDGISTNVLHSTGLQYPHGITLDYDSQTLYWIDAGMDRIEMSNVDGSSRTVLTNVNVIVIPYGITFFDGRLYWTDTSRDQILSASVSSPDSVSVLLSVSNPYRLKVVSQNGQKQSMLKISCSLLILLLSSIAFNPCLLNNGNCSHLCLLSAISASGYTCACPTGLMPDNNGKDCFCMHFNYYLILITSILYGITVSPYLIFTNRYNIYRVEVDGTGLQSLKSVSYAYGVDFDYK